MSIIRSDFNIIQCSEERLRLSIAKQEAEIARLKKGYFVKGVGAKKEYVTYYNEERSAYSLNYKSPVQYRIEQGF